jgi:hypothetical protein
LDYEEEGEGLNGDNQIMSGSECGRGQQRNKENMNKFNYY